MNFDTFRDQVWNYREIFKISNVFGCIFEHIILQPDQHLFVFLHIDEFQLIDRWESDAIMKRKMVEKKLFKQMINDFASFMISPPYEIFVQTFLSGTAPQVVISAKESSRVSFEFVKCPQLLTLEAMLEIANHYAQKFDAEKFNCGRTNGCFVNHFSNFWKTPEDCLVHFSTSLRNALELMERNSSMIFINSILIPSSIMSNNISKHATTYMKPSRIIKNLL
jgi:hypothetical protein